MKKIDTSVTHITSEEDNIFDELGFNPIEAAKLKIKAQLMCQIGEWIKEKQLEKRTPKESDMITKAIIKNGGLFIPDVQSLDQYGNQEVRIEFRILEQKVDEDIFRKTAGLLKRKKIDPLKFQADQRAEWDGQVSR